MVGYGVGIMLLATVAGYLVLERAAKQRGRLRQAGIGVGAFVIGVSVLCVLCQAASMTACGSAGGMCGKYGGGGRMYGRCPLTHKAYMMPIPQAATPEAPDEAPARE